MGQLSFTEAEYSRRKRRTKKEEFLDSMDEIIPWKEWIALIEPCYYNNRRGWRAKDIETMLRMYLLQNWYRLSDEAVEDAIYDSYAMKKFLKLDFNKETVPDATTLLKFRHILEENKIGEKIFADVKDHWDKYIESRKSSVRSKVEHPFLIIKHKFGYSKVAYRGIAKNLNRLNVLFASVNLVMCIRAGRSSEFIRA